ncbi:hypothetical protein J6590_105317 [Homalodisca vitripennis]|nr:hypothetical protein J6590_105317 [Homalodisca vitripennis]
MLNTGCCRGRLIESLSHSLMRWRCDSCVTRWRDGVADRPCDTDIPASRCRRGHWTLCEESTGWKC